MIEHANVIQLANRWWLLVVRGIAAILFGVLVFVAPRMSLLALVLLWGAYALVDGAFNLGLALRRARAGRSWGWLAFEGVVSLLAAAVAFFWPGITALALVLVIGARATLAGIAQIAAAIRLRRQIRGEWLLAFCGVFSILFGVALFAFPGAGALALLWLIGTQAILVGAFLAGLGLRLRSWRRSIGHAVPPGAMPTPA